ncbi:MAG: TonB family protein [Phenylobacterium sp.]|uniref:TonB family protein n=1 Tax=Phenylobacterium sp. TaxID=1871053 RepID=UPI0012220B5A|nr:TonB family protein [Phenylobacterium sp.]TAJ69962.1 MAG: TonB family protein [Phenylobacterium sp.]
MAFALQAADVAPAVAAPAVAPMTVPPTGPLWVRTPTPRQLERFGEGLPVYIRARPQSVVIECRIAVDGTLEQCAVVDETPVNRAFGKSALRLMSRFQFVTTLPDGQSTVGGTLRVPIRWGWPD